MCLSKACQFRIGSGKEQYITRRLAEIDGLIAVAYRSFLGK
jgi:type III secretory pathway lipoprotein EscJ